MIRIMRFLNSRPPCETADTIALFVAMDLLSGGTSGIKNNPSKKLAYQSLKTALSACEQTGQYTTNFLAAEVLTAVYELGQGLYPAPYITIGTCSRVCYAIGLHNKRLATQLPRKVDTWTEVEERRRLWWATITLDRYVTIGFTFRPLSIPSIPPNEIIPGDDESWDHGELSVNPLLVMSIEAQTKVSPYARTCQAAHLLGRVCQHANEHADPADDDFHFHEAQQIQLAATAFFSILQQEYRDSPEGYKLFNAMALCCSALLTVYHVHSCIEIEPIESSGQNRGMRLDLQQLAIDGYRRIASTTSDFAAEILKIVARNPDAISPLVCHSLYQAGASYAWIVRENGSESHLASLIEIREVLKMVQQRWSVAGK